MADEPEECCNPMAKNDAERCYACPMREKPLVTQPLQQKPAEGEQPKATVPLTPPKKIPDWQAIVDDLPTE